MVTAPTPAPSRSRQRWIIAAGAGAVVLVVVGVLALWPRSNPTYDDTVRARFMEACTAQGGEPVRDTCACLYGELEATVPFDRFEQVDDQLAAQLQETTPGQSLALPEDVRSLLDACVVSTS